MASFTITSSTAVTVAQTLSGSSEIGFIGTLGSLVTGNPAAVLMTGAGASLINNGAIVSNSTAVSASAACKITNAGLMVTELDTILIDSAAVTAMAVNVVNAGDIISTNGSALQINEAGVTVSNSGYITGNSNTIRIDVTATTGNITTRIVNSGIIDSQETDVGVIFASGGRTVIVNTGEILGRIGLAQGNDIIDNRAGTITGSVDMEDGDNEYHGGEGTDNVSSGNGTDDLYGGGGDDVLSSQDGNDNLRGGDGEDDLRGGLGNDSLRGGEGDDTLYGADGADTLVGRGGADTFLFFNATDSDTLQAPDEIRGFDRGADVIDLEFVLGATFAFAGKNPLLGGGTASVAYTRAGSVLTVVADIDGDGGADMRFLVTGITALGAEDFVL